MLQFLLVTGLLLAKNNQIDLEAEAAPISMNLEQFLEEARLAFVAQAQEENGIIAGDTISPKSGLPLRVGCQDLLVRTKSSVRIEQQGQQTLYDCKRCVELVFLHFTVDMPLRQLKSMSKPGPRSITS